MVIIYESHFGLRREHKSWPEGRGTDGIWLLKSKKLTFVIFPKFNNQKKLKALHFNNQYLLPKALIIFNCPSHPFFLTLCGINPT